MNLKNAVEDVKISINKRIKEISKMFHNNYIIE